jgi:hypothetical protein
MMKRGKGDVRGQKRRARQRKRSTELPFFARIIRFLKNLFGNSEKSYASSQVASEPHNRRIRVRHIKIRIHRVRHFKRRGSLAPSHSSISRSNSLLRNKIIGYKKSHGGKNPPKSWTVWQSVKVSHAVVRLRGYRGHWVRQKIRKGILNRHGIPYKMH